jgi:glutathione peroxidase
VAWLDCAGGISRAIAPRAINGKVGKSAGALTVVWRHGRFLEVSLSSAMHPTAHPASGGLVMKLVAVLSLGLFVIAFVAPAWAADKASPLDFKMKSIDGKDVDLSKYKGDVVLIVNVASKCGLTPQYKQLEEVYSKYKDKGLQVLGFPANEFGKQEPGSNEEIVKFCSSKYSVDFPMFSKIVVKGEGIDPLYQFLTSEETNPGLSGDIKWNFEKFLVGRDGKVIKRFDPPVKPDSQEVIDAIEVELNKKS